MKIGVMGAGGVGGYYGARLASAGAEVGLIARGEHLAAIREHGLRVRADDGDFTVRVAASDDPAEPGVVEQVGSVRRVIFGELDGSRSERVTRLLAEFRKAGIDTDLADDIHVVLWDKFAYLCALAGLTAVTRLPIDKLLAVPETRKLFREVVREVSLVARAEGVELADDIVDQKTAFAENLGPDSYSSLYHDLVTGHRLELDALHGELTRRAARHGIRVPVSEVVYALLRPWEAAHATSPGTRSLA